MANSKVIVFWVRELFYDLKLLPRVFFLSYVMGSKGDHYEPVVREKERQGETVMVYCFLGCAHSEERELESIMGVTGLYPPPFSWATCGIWGAQVSLREQGHFQDPRELLGTGPAMEDPRDRVSSC